MSHNPRRTEQQVHAEGMAVRREVLSDYHNNKDAGPNLDQSHP